MKPPYLQHASKTFAIETAAKNKPRSANETQNKFVALVPEHCRKCFVKAPPRGQQTGWLYTPKGLLCPKEPRD